MTDSMFLAQCLSQYQEILSKTRLFGTRNYSKLGRSLLFEIILNSDVHLYHDYYDRICLAFRAIDPSII